MCKLQTGRRCSENCIVLLCAQVIACEDLRVRVIVANLLGTICKNFELKYQKTTRTLL